MKRIIVVGATGSIGRQCIEVALSRPEAFEVVGLSANTDEAGLVDAGLLFPRAALALSGAVPSDPRIGLHGPEGLDELMRETDAEVVLNGAAGARGLSPSLAALESGKDLALANKESVVMGWSLLSAAAGQMGHRIIPVDSEHAGLFQLIGRFEGLGIEEVLITASGGAFRDLPLEALDSVTAQEAARHPNWSMGRKITIDSATMANKGLEVIEASRLFGLQPDRVRVLIHPQSLVHALVRAQDGSLYAQLSEPDMRVPIQNALTWPETLPCPFGRLDLAGRSLEFRSPDPARYPLLFTAYEALRSGDGATVAYNAADEVAVAAFEAGGIGFRDIARVVSTVLERAWPSRLGDLESIFHVDAEARSLAESTSREF